MIKSDFYSTSSTIGGDMLITNSVTGLNLTDNSDPAAPYYMGNLNMAHSLFRYGIFTAKKSGEDISTYSYKFNPDKSVKSHWLYMNADTNTYFSLGYNGSKWVGDYKFFNGFAPYKMSLNYGATLTLSLRMYDFTNDHTLGNGEHVLTNNSYWNYDLNLSGDRIYEFFNKGLSVTVSFNGTDYQINYEGYNKQKHCWELGSGKTVYIISATFPVNNTSTYYNSNSTRCEVINGIQLPESGSYSNWNGTAITRPATVLFCDAYYLYPSDSRIDVDTHRYRTNPGLYNAASMYAFDEDNIVTLGGAPFEVSYIAIRYATNQSKMVQTTNGVLMEGTGSDQVRINYFVDLDDIYYSGWGNAPKHTTSKDDEGNTIAGYSNNTSTYDKYQDVPIFKSNNVFDKRVKEDKYKDLEPQLQPWQKYGYDITDDEFDPEGEGGGDDNWDPDTATGDDTNDYEEDPTTTLNKPPFGGYGPRFWVMSNSEFQAIYDSIMQIYKAYANYFRVNSLDPAKALAFSWLSAQEAIQRQYCGFAGGNPLDAVAAVFWYPFDVGMVLQTVNANFRWGLTDMTDWVSGDGTDGAPPVVAVQQKLEAIDFADNAYWLDGGFTDYFKHYENFMDYSPYCRAELYLPYCGSIQIDPNMFVGHHISVRYLIDFNSGSCLALVYRDNLVVNSIAGQIGVQLPISGPNYGTYISQVVSATSGVNNARIGLIGSAVSALTATGQIGGAIAAEAAISGIGGGLNVLGHNAPTLMGAGLNVARSVNDFNSASYSLEATKPAMQICSTATPIISAANEQVCRLVLYQPRWLEGYGTNDYGNYGHTTGFATIENKTLSNFTGLTIAESVDTSGIGQATEKEKAMIQQAFKGGVYMPNS